MSALGGQASPVAPMFIEARKLAAHLESGIASQQRMVLVAIVERIVLGEQSVKIEIRHGELERGFDAEKEADDDRPPIQIETSVTFARRGVETRLLVSGAHDPAASRLVDGTLLKAVARGCVWFEELTSGRASSIVDIAKREGLSDRFVSFLLDLAFLAPSAIEAIVEGRQPATLTAKGLMFAKEIPLLWA